jgi:hypothetical protein
MMRARAIRIVFLVSLVLTSACASTSLKDALHPHFLGGKDAEAWIDRRVGNMLAVYHPELAIGRAHCPFLLNLTGPHSQARCTLRVEQGTLRIDVVSDNGVSERLRDVDSLVAERDLAADLARSYTEPYTVHCEGDPVHVVPAGEAVDCTATGSDGLRKTLRAWPRGYTGSLAAGGLDGAETVAERTLGRDVVERRHGGVTLNGRDVERYLAASAAGAEREDLLRRGLLRRPYCPPSVSLHGTTHDFCYVPVGEKTLRYDLRFDEGRGLVIKTDATALPVAALDEMAARYFERVFRDDGTPQKVVVDCGRAQVLVLEAGAHVPCVLRTFRAKRDVAITMVSVDEFRFELTDD